MPKDNKTADRVQAMLNFIGGDDVLDALMAGRARLEIVLIKHTVDLGAPPRLPFDGAEVVKHKGTGVVEIELRQDDHLYVGGKKVELFLSTRQMGSKAIVGHELLVELEGGKQVLLNSNVLGYLCDHPELFPEHWKKDANGETRYIFFWGSIFRNPSGGNLYVRCLCWSGGRLYRSRNWLGNDWGRRCPSASLAS